MHEIGDILHGAKSFKSQWDEILYSGRVGGLFGYGMFQIPMG